MAGGQGKERIEGGNGRERWKKWGLGSSWRGELEGLVGRETAERSRQAEASCSRAGELQGYRVVCEGKSGCLNLDLQRWNKSRLGHRPLTVEAFALHRPECLRSPAAPPLHLRTSPCGPEVRSHRRKAVHICCAFHWATPIEMLSLWRAPRAHLPGSTNLWDCGPAPGSNGEAGWTPCCPYDQGLVIKPLGVFRASLSVGWRYPADNRPLTPCPKCCPASFPNIP